MLKIKKVILSAFLLQISYQSYAIESDFKAEVKLNVRHSEHNRFPTRFPPSSAHETVDEGAKAEISNIALFFNVRFLENITLLSKVDIIDLYEKNPTSSDHDISLDHFILRLGKKYTNQDLPEQIDFYVQTGKFGKFERQEDRHLESYGLISTAFNRLEDTGFEAGIDLPAGFYGKLSYTTGNPVFFRDPNALAGDNGVDDADYKPGVLILYDAEVEGFDLNDTPETGAALGYRFVDQTGLNRFNIMAFGYQRDLADSKELNGTIYGGDIDLFEFSELFTPGPVDPNNDQSSVPLSSDEKSEFGLNIWWYYNNFALFSQYVSQDIGGLERYGAELEVSYAFETESISFLENITPVVRYSFLDNDFSVPANNPSPSITWDWQKLDIGVNFQFSKHSTLTIEYAYNQFELPVGDRENNEWLVTYRWRYN